MWRLLEEYPTSCVRRAERRLKRPGVLGEGRQWGWAGAPYRQRPGSGQIHQWRSARSNGWYRSVQPAVTSAAPPHMNDPGALGEPVVHTTRSRVLQSGQEAYSLRWTLLTDSWTQLRADRRQVSERSSESSVPETCTNRQQSSTSRAQTRTAQPAAGGFKRIPQHTARDLV